MLRRCYDEKFKEKSTSYQDVECCKEWLYYPNFYEWIHSQSNFEKWLNKDRFALDKDIIDKDNKVYSMNKCCLVPLNVNSLFTKSNASRGNLPIGVTRHGSKYRARLSVRTNEGTENVYLGSYDTAEEAFAVYKEAKEAYIKQVAEEEYSIGNITKECYDAMMNYEVEITD